MRLRRGLGRASALVSTLAIGLTLALLSLAEPLPVKALRNVLFDAYQRAAPRAFDAATLPAIVVDIDDESLERIGQWPWPRNVVADLVRGIGSRNPAVIALDVLFAEADRTSPENALKGLPPSPERDALAAQLARQDYSHDRVLAQALAETRAVSGVVLTDVERRAPVIAGFARAGDDPLPFIPKFSGAVGPIDVLRPALKGFGALNWVPEYDQVVRRVPTVLAQGDVLTPSLAVEALRVAQEASTIIIKASNASGESGFGQSTGVVSLKVGDVVIPTDADGAIRIRYAGPRPERRIPAWHFLSAQAGVEKVQDRIVFIGSSASAIADVRATPLSPATPGVEVHAEIVEHILGGSQLTRPDWMPGAEAALTLFAALMAAAVGYKCAPVAAASIGVVSVAAVAFASWRAFTHHDLLMDPALPSLAGLLTFSVTSVARWRRSDAERRAVRDAFGRYLSPAMVERLASDPGRLVLGGEQRKLTLLFSDVRGFTGLAETYAGDPQGLTELMNRLLTPLTDAIVQRSGTIDKFMGDAIMAFWNAPLDVSDHAAEACRAALDMRKRLAALNAELAQEAQASRRQTVPIRVGIGINTGLCVVGNMGSQERFNYSVLGDPVNLASRLEGQTRHYGFDILIGEATEALVRGRFALVEIDHLRVKGRAQAERLFALLGDDAAMRDEKRGCEALTARIAAMLASYRKQDWNAAGDLLAGIETFTAFGHPDFAAVRSYAAFMRSRIDDHRKHPPPQGWDGAYNADGK